MNAMFLTAAISLQKTVATLLVGITARARPASVPTTTVFARVRKNAITLFLTLEALFYYL